MKINIIGTGYVGLVSGVCLAAKGHKVKCFDTNKNTIEILKSGKSHIHENNLEKLMKDFSKNISFHLLNTNSEYKLLDCEAILIAVGTPTVDDKIYLGQIKNACLTVGKLIKDSNKFISIIIKSTVVPGTTDTFVKKIIEDSSGKKLGDFGLGMNPEFLREGNAVEDFMDPDRIVFGYDDEKTLGILKKIYSPWETFKVEVNTRSAEMIKYVNNSLLATQISAINEYSNIAKSIGGINFNRVMNGVHLDNRWSPKINNNKIFPKIIDYLKPGCGFGGSCFPKDVKAIAALAKEVGVKPIILDSVIQVNKNQPSVILNVLKNRVGNFINKKILILGLSFKPDTDDVRESVSLELLKILSNESCKISAHDPIAIENAKKSIDFNDNICFVNDWKKEIINNDIIIVSTNWNDYKEIKNLDKFLKNKILFDTRSLFKDDDFSQIEYLNIN